MNQNDMISKITLYASEDTENLALPFTVEFVKMDLESLNLSAPEKFREFVKRSQDDAILLAHTLSKVMSTAMFVFLVSELNIILERFANSLDALDALANEETDPNSLSDAIHKN